MRFSALTLLRRFWTSEQTTAKTMFHLRTPTLYSLVSNCAPVDPRRLAAIVCEFSRSFLYGAFCIQECDKQTASIFRRRHNESASESRLSHAERARGAREKTSGPSGNGRTSAVPSGPMKSHFQPTGVRRIRAGQGCAVSRWRMHVRKIAKSCAMLGGSPSALPRQAA